MVGNDLLKLPNLKRILYLFVIILLFFQSGGMLMFYRMEQQIQQYKMKRVLESEKSHLQHFTLSMNEFLNSKLSGEEILIKGRMYDMKSYSFHGNTVIIVAMHDNAEELILKAIKKALKAGDRQDNGLLVKIVKLLTLDYSIPYSFQIPALLHRMQNLFLIFSEIIDSRIPDILTPPPRFA
jgi:hypothetical protein